MPMDQGEGQRWAVKPGNFYSKPVKMRLDPATTGLVKISMDQEIPPIEPPKDTAQVKYLRVQNDRLTKFWGRPMHLGAIVCCRSDGARIRIALSRRDSSRPFSEARMAADGWRETPPDAGVTRAAAPQQKPPTSSTRIGTDRISRA
jgi:hypothetical protein